MITFINPWAFVWLWLAIPILILYAFRQRRYVHHTGAGMLWKESISILNPRYWWNPWRRPVSLLLQLAILVTFVFAMAEPCFRPPQRLAVIIDCTQSMSDILGVDGKSAISSEVRQKLAEMVTNLGYHDRIALIAAQSPAKILCRTTSDKEKILTAIDEYFQKPELTPNAMAMNQAIDVARALVAKQVGEMELDPRTQNIVLISDGCFPEFDKTIQTPGVHWLPVGTTRDNFSLISVGLRNTPEGKLATLCTFANYSDKEQTGTITASRAALAPGNDERNNPQNSTQNVPSRNSQLTTRNLTDISAKPNQTLSTIIELDAQTIDENDNIVITWKPSVGKERTVTLPAIKSTTFTVYLVSKGNPALEEAFKAFPAVRSVTTVTKIPDSLPKNAILVFDEASPTEMPNAFTISIAPKKTNNLWKAVEEPVNTVVNSMNMDLDANIWTGVNLVGQQFTAPATIEPIVPAVVLATDKQNQALAWAINGETKSQHFVFACQKLQNIPGYEKLLENIVCHWSNGNFDPIATEEFCDEDWRVPTSTVDTFSLPGEDVIPLWTILGVILLVTVCIEWYLYQRRWLE